MKNKIGMGALCVLMACALMVSIGCKNDDGDSLVSTLGAPKIDTISGLTSLGDGVTATVTTFSQAEDLVNGLFDGAGGSSLGYALADAQGAAFLAAFAEKYGSYIAWWASQDPEKKYSFSVKVDDSTSLKKETGTAEGTIKVSAKSSWSHNRLTLGEMYLPDHDQVGDKVSSSDSGSGTISITSGYVTASGYRVAGIINAEYSEKRVWTVKDVTNNISTASNSDKQKVALTVLVSDGTRAAKIRFSSSFDGAWRERSAGWGGSNNTADVEVYSPAGVLLFTLPPSKVDEREQFLRNFISTIKVE